MRKFSFLKGALLGGLLIASFAVAQIGSAQMGPGGNFTGGSAAPGSGSQQVPLQHTVLCANVNNVHGELFSSNIGWIYLNCADFVGIGNVPPFGVYQDTSGYWSGYGWSDEVGWIQFGNPPGAPISIACPQDQPTWSVKHAAGASDCNVVMLGTGASAKVVGWARAITPALAPATAGGWDGWISMSGLNDQKPTLAGLQTTTNYATVGGTPVNGQTPITGFVWGSDIIGWAKFYNAYVTTPTITNGPRLSLTAVPASISGGQQTMLTYSTSAADAPSFTTGTCTGTVDPVGSTTGGWEVSTLPNVSTTLLSQNQGAYISGASGSYIFKVTCPISVQGNPSLTTATATTTVTKSDGTVNLTTAANDICIAGSHGPTSTTLTWTSSQNTSYCELSTNGVLDTAHLLPNGSVPVGNFQSVTSSPYVTPSTPGSTNAYFMKCFDSAGNSYASHDGGATDVYVGVAPAAFNGATANGTLDCADSPYSINLSAPTTILCPSVSTGLTLNWSPSGNVPIDFTYAKLLKTNGLPPTHPDSQTAINTTHTGLTDSMQIYSAGTYWLYYFENDNVTNSGQQGVIGGPIRITQSVGSVCHTFRGPSTPPLCPIGSINTSYAIPHTYGWTASSGAICTQNGTTVSPGTPGGAVSGGFTIDTNNAPATGSSVSTTIACNWTDGTQAGGTYSYTMQSRSSTICSTQPGTAGVPIIKEQ